MKEICRKRLLSALLVLFLVFRSTVIPVWAETKEEMEINQAVENAKENAIEWILNEADASNAWQKDGLINTTCNVMAVLSMYDVDVESQYTMEWREEHKELNLDEICHLSWGLSEEERLSDIWGFQNADGGFGLTEDYESDPYDTLLVLMAEAANQTQSLEEKQIENAVLYLSECQKEDGGIGYTENDSSRLGLSAELGLSIHSLGLEAEPLESGLKDYCQSCFEADFSEEKFYEQAEAARYLYEMEEIKDADTLETTILSLPLENGSIYNNIEDTLQYILLLDSISQYHALQLDIQKIDGTADRYVLEADTTETVMVKTTIDYTSNQDVELFLRYIVQEDEKEILKEEENCKLLKDAVQAVHEKQLDISVKEGHEYKQIIILYQTDEDGNETILAQTSFDYHLHISEEKELLLNADVTYGSDYSVSLYWNDISSQDERYGYQLYRSKEGQEFETCSTWNEDIVKVLNVYPDGAYYLYDWMNSTVDGSDEIASRNLLDITGVPFSKYNLSPEDYLLDENGYYQYDVIMFGSYDCNGGWDLSDASYQATREFADSGRGVLFGHDSVVDNPSQVHKNLAKFAPDIGLQFYQNIPDGYGTQVDVVNDGFLTSFPWKISGTLEVPYSHSSSQFIDPDKNATVWIVYHGRSPEDCFYLITRNAFAMIQTGHSDGAATDDERRILANTLFYLKQITNDTSVVDHSFYDEAAPEITDVSEADVNGIVTIQAVDRGTKYQYYVQGTNESADNAHRIKSNLVEKEAISNIQGYIVTENGSADALSDFIQYNEIGEMTNDVIPATDGILEYTVSELKPGEEKYLHIFAVDGAGNISQEFVNKVETAKETVSGREYFEIPYALFSTEGEVTLNCSTASINADIYAEKQFNFQGSTLNLNGTAATPGTLYIYGGSISLENQQEGIPSVTLPDYTDVILNDMHAECEEVERLDSYNNTSINVPTICKGTTGAWCSDISIEADFLSEQSISFNGNNVNLGNGEKIVVCAKDGDINIQATDLTGDGLIYAPNGTVTIQTCQFHFKGTIIAKNIRLQMTECNINQE